jgi:hypothetical protein
VETRVVITWLFRSLLLASVLASLVVRFEGLRIREATAPGYNVDTAIREIIQDRGFPLLENPAKPPKVLSRAVYFQRPECSRTSLVLPFALNSEVLLYLDKAIKPDFEPRFFYLDKSWQSYDRFAMYFEWGKNVLLGSFGGPRYITETTAIVVAEPSDCDHSASIDWRKAWGRDRRRDGSDVGTDFRDRRPGLAAGQG